MRASDPVSRLGLIAGCGSLPGEAARLVRASTTVCAIAFEGLTDAALARDVDEFRWHRLGQLEAAAASLRSMAVQQLLLVGAIPKQVLFDGSARLEPDPAASALLGNLAGWKDDALFSALADWLEGQGFAIGRQDVLLARLVAREGLWSSRAPGPCEQADLEVGLRALAGLGATGIGQCVVVRHGCVVAVEGAEGTDATIRRAGEVAGPGATVVKGLRVGQDRRFDLPAVGPGTIAAMVEARASCLAVEAGGTLVLDREATRARADQAGIACTGFRPDRAAS